MQAQESLQHSGVRPLLPMVVLLQPDSFWVLGEEYEIARDENGFWSAQDVATEHLKITSDSNAYMYGRNFYGKVPAKQSQLCFIRSVVCSYLIKSSYGYF